MQTVSANKYKSMNNAMRLYLKEISRIPLLTREEEMSLGYRARAGDKDAEQKLIESNLRFVIKIAKKYRPSQLPLLDLINEGNVGLIEAARRFDPDRQVRFTSYAVWWIRQAILFYLSRSNHIFRVTPRAANVLYRVARHLAKNRTEEKPNREDLAREIGVSLNELNAALEADAGTISLDQPFQENGDLRLADLMEQHIIPSAEAETSALQLKEYLGRSLEKLNSMEKTIVRYRFGLDDDAPLTLREVGEKLNLSRERIRQIEEKALIKLRETLRESSLAGYIN